MSLHDPIIFRSSSGEIKNEVHLLDRLGITKARLCQTQTLSESLCSNRRTTQSAYPHQSSVHNSLAATAPNSRATSSCLLHESVDHGVQVNTLALIQHRCQHALDLASFETHLADIVHDLLCGHLCNAFTLGRCRRAGLLSVPRTQQDLSAHTASRHPRTLALMGYSRHARGTVALSFRMQIPQHASGHAARPWGVAARRLVDDITQAASF